MRIQGFASLAVCLAALALVDPPRAARADAASDAAAAEAQKAAAALAERMRSADADVKKTALAESAKVQHPLITAALSKALSDADAGIRAAALTALLARTGEVARKAAAVAIAARLERIAKKDEDYPERMKVIAALHDLAQPVSLKALSAETGVDVSSEELSLRLRAIANLPSKEAIEEIIQFRSSGGRLGRGDELGYRRRIAREAFFYATGADVGHDPDEMRKWWKEHEKGFDFQAAAERRGREGGGPKSKAGDGTSPDTGKPAK